MAEVWTHEVLWDDAGDGDRWLRCIKIEHLEGVDDRWCVDQYPSPQYLGKKTIRPLPPPDPLDVDEPRITVELTIQQHNDLMQAMVIASLTTNNRLYIFRNSKPEVRRIVNHDAHRIQELGRAIFGPTYDDDNVLPPKDK